MSTTDGSTPGVQSHVPGEDDSDSSIGGVAPDGTALSHVDDDSLPAQDGLSSGGDTVADDADTADGDTADAQTDADVAADLDAADETDSPEHRSGTGDNAPEDVDGPGAADEGAAPSGSAAEQGDDAVRAAQASAFTHP
ncbi:hypothetical protein ALI44B_01675 [Leifsonia sp. ALI-44-B]|uniref:hypothetical protein n=1 Tax=Leifsonia sp. ALI-44-B TaxID=1933776 RepID=UPI00097C356C|nr:hypothetical protein [Leifsonia sp. ALI-44-B]ONI63450.1 hypothetical protein ALI44B_01675 [Leifsonia sp. ALI-44-B]